MTDLNFYLQWLNTAQDKKDRNQKIANGYKAKNVQVPELIEQRISSADRQIEYITNKIEEISKEV